LTHRAFDSEPQRQQTSDLFADYNRDHDITPELDARFAALAAERIHAAPIRYYVWLPTLRIVDMWLRPRTELCPSDPRWWEFNDDGRWLAVSLGFGVINLLYVVLSAAGLMRSHAIFGIGLFVLFLLLRSAFLGTLENPEPVHAGMLSRGHSSGFGLCLSALAPACINFQSGSSSIQTFQETPSPANSA